MKKILLLAAVIVVLMSCTKDEISKPMDQENEFQETLIQDTLYNKNDMLVPIDEDI